MSKKKRRKNIFTRMFSRREPYEPPKTVERVQVAKTPDPSLPNFSEFRTWIDQTPEAKTSFEKFCTDNQLYGAWRHTNSLSRMHGDYSDYEGY